MRASKIRAGAMHLAHTLPVVTVTAGIALPGPAASDSDARPHFDVPAGVQELPGVELGPNYDMGGGSAIVRPSEGWAWEQPVRFAGVSHIEPLDREQAWPPSEPVVLPGWRELPGPMDLQSEIEPFQLD